MLYVIPASVGFGVVVVVVDVVVVVEFFGAAILYTCLTAKIIRIAAITFIFHPKLSRKRGNSNISSTNTENFRVMFSVSPN